MKLKKTSKLFLRTIFNHKRFLFAISDEIEAGLLNFKYNGYLKEIGFLNSLLQKKPLGPQNEPYPWVTYPFIHFIEPRLKKDFTLFEYGSGNSTLYYASKVKKVVSVEHDRTWYEKIKKELSHPNVSLLFQELENNAAYCRMSITTGEKYDLIIVDGRDRVNCIKHSIEVLNSRGVIILDNSYREKYSEGIEYLKENKFKRIDFWGMCPGNRYLNATSVFYRENNCLDI